MNFNQIHTQAMKEYLKILKKTQEQIAVILQLISKQQIKYYNQCHKSMFYAIKNEVLLSTKNLFTWRSFHKLENKFRESFKIINVHNEQAYMLKLSKTMKEIHSTFYISLLELYCQQNNDQMKSELEDSVVINEELEWEMKDIVEKQFLNEKTKYLIKWKHYSDYKNFWQISENLAEALKIMQTFEECQKVSKKTDITQLSFCQSCHKTAKRWYLFFHEIFESISFSLFKKSIYISIYFMKNLYI